MLGIDRKHAGSGTNESEQIRAFLEASDEVDFKGRSREERYDRVNQTLRQQRY